MTTTNKLNTQELQDMRDEFVPRAIGNGNLAIADYASGATVTDIDGKKWIDFASAIGTLNVGHSHPRITKKVHEQVDKFLHPGFNVIMYESYLKLAKKVCEITPGTMAKQAAFFNSGAEAVENAVKIARHHTGKKAVVTFNRGFHGRTNLTMGMTSKVRPFKVGFGPFTPELYQAPFPYNYHKNAKLTDEEYVQEIIKEFDEFFLNTVSKDEVACLVMEPIQGESGFIIPDKKFVQHVYDFCEKNNIIFIADEIQTGFGRTGKMFAMEHFDIVPDLMTISKSLAAGLPLSGVVGKKEFFESISPGELGGTYAGNPVACEAALEVIEVIKDEDLVNQSNVIGKKITNKLEDLASKHDYLGEIRAIGSMVAVELVTDQDTKLPYKEKADSILKYANEHGLLLLSSGIHGNVVRFLVPLVITDEELNKGLDILEKAFAN